MNTYPQTTIGVPTQGSPDPVSSAVGGIVEFVIAVAFIVAYWKVFVKAGQAGWKSLIPIYNVYIIIKIAGKPWWWLLIFLIPLVNLVFIFITLAEFATRFGRSGLFGVFLLGLFPIGWFILAFGKDTYKMTPSKA